MPKKKKKRGHFGLVWGGKENPLEAKKPKRSTSRSMDEGRKTRKNKARMFSLVSHKPGGKDIKLTGLSQKEQRKIWEEESSIPSFHERHAAAMAGVDISPKKKKTNKLLAKAAKARAKRK